MRTTKERRIVDSIVSIVPAKMFPKNNHSCANNSGYKFQLTSDFLFLRIFFPFFVGRPILQKVTLSVRKLNLADYETYHYEKERLKQVCEYLITSQAVGILPVRQK